MSDQIDEVERIRMRNNHLWINLMRLALKYAPGQAKCILSEINHNDAAVTALLKEVASSED